MIDEYGTLDEIRIGRGNRSTVKVAIPDTGNSNKKVKLSL
jgi:hypothetical protein